MDYTALLAHIEIKFEGIRTSIGSVHTRVDEVHTCVTKRHDEHTKDIHALDARIRSLEEKPAAISRYEFRLVSSVVVIVGGVLAYLLNTWVTLLDALP